MTVTHEHLAGLKLAMLQWNKGGPAAHFATQLSDLVAQAKAASADPATGTEQVSSTWLAQLREEYLTFGSECQRLTAENARLRQHKTEYMEAAEETRRALSARLTELEARQGEYSDAYQGAREDLSIWKRRALEAEEKVRHQEQIIDHMGEALNDLNGPTFMGEPVVSAEQQGVAGALWELLRELEQFFEGAGVSPGPGLELRIAAMLAAAPEQGVES